GDFRMPFVIDTYKPEDQLFVSRIHKEGNIKVCAVLNGIVKTIKAQNFCVFFVKEVIVVKLHDIAGKFASLGAVSFMVNSDAGTGHDKLLQPSGCLPDFSNI
ncbi:hypothetical protein ABL231_004918, partial [Escherichia coli]